MKKLIFWTFFVLIILSSCATAKKCTKRFPPQTITIVKDSIHTEIQYRDTTVYIKLPVEKVVIFDTVFLKNGVIQFKEIKAQTNYATARAWIGQNRINLELTDKDTLLSIKLKKLI
jgi:ABC-type enterochelin transport system substrate-binding protein